MSLYRCSGGIFDLDTALPHLQKLQQDADHPDLWQDPKAAETLLREKTQLEKRIGGFQALEGKYNDLMAMLELAESEGEAELAADCEQKLEALRQKLAERALESLLSARRMAMIAISKSMPVRAVPKRRIGRKCCCACIQDGRNSAAIKSNG